MAKVENEKPKIGACLSRVCVDYVLAQTNQNVNFVLQQNYPYYSLIARAALKLKFNRNLLILAFVKQRFRVILPHFSTGLSLFRADTSLGAIFFMSKG